MSAPMIIKLETEAGRVSWWHPVAGAGAGAPAEVPSAGGSALLVLAPAEEILVAEVELPGRNRARLEQALPFALEEHLADELERHHFALGEALGPGRYLAAAVDRGLMDRWLELLRGAALSPSALLPDALALPAPPNDVTGVVAIDGARALVRIGGARAFAVGRDELAAFLALEPQLREVAVHGDGSLSLPGIAVTTVGGSLPELLARGARGTGLNLLQGPYRPASEKSARAERTWRFAAGAALAAALLALVGQGLEYRQAKERVAALDERAAALLKRAFPDTVRVVNPRAQMAQGLDELRAARGDLGQAGFLYLLRIAGPALVETGGVSLKALSYRADGLVLDVHARDLARIEAVRQQIRDRSGVAVVLESAATLADGADGRLRLQGAPG